MIKFGAGNLRIPKFEKPVYIVAGGLTDYRKRYPEKNSCELCMESVNMAVREMMNNADEDGDGAIGTISDDGNAANDPTFGQAQVLVISAVAGPQTTLRSKGRSGDARREVETVLE